MSNCTMSLERTGKQIILVVKNAPESLRPVLDGLGINLVTDIANRRQVVCSNAAELDAARNPLRSYFDAQGNLINQ